jgi:hypothetical protein
VLIRLSVDLIEKVNNDKHQIYSDSDAALKAILSKYLLSFEIEKECEAYLSSLRSYI